MKLSHYSENGAIRKLDTRTDLKSHMKPFGLWVSVDGEYDWKSWCLSERFRLSCLRYRYEVKLNHDAKILRLVTVDQMLEFHRRYLSDHEVNRISRSMYIDWHRVAETYEGIIIAPYQWSVRMDLMWYYGWDCASGCIWEPTAIESFTCIEEKDYTVENEDASKSDTG